MAVTITLIFQGTDSSINDVTATADADAAAVVPHGLGAVPAEVYTEARTFAIPKTRSLGVIDATNVNLVMGVVVGSGQATAQIRVIAKRPHTVGR